MSIKFLKVLVSLFIFSLCFSTRLGIAANINVAAPAEGQILPDTVANDGQCTLREAVLSANLDNNSYLRLAQGEEKLVGECEAGEGTDEIIIVPGAYEINGTSLQVTSNLTFRGRRVDNHTPVFLPKFPERPLTLLEISSPEGEAPITVDVRNIKFRNGNGNPFGGAMTVGARDTANLYSCYLTGNTASFRGGAIYNQGTLRISDTTLHQNSVERGNGGAVYNLGILTIESNSVFSQNLAQDSGGAIYNEGVLWLSLSTFSENTARFGGAIANLAAGEEVNPNLRVNRRGNINLGSVAFERNEAIESGGAILSNNAENPQNIFDTTFFSNSASNGSGGGVYNANGSFYLINTTFSENYGRDSGGAIFNDNGTVYLTSSTLWQNKTHTQDKGAGVQQGVRGEGRILLRNSILAQNKNTTDNSVHDCSGNISSNNYNLLSHVPQHCFFHAQEKDRVEFDAAQLRLAELGMHNGFTKTHPLQAGSIALNYIPAANCIRDNDNSPNATDQRGTARPQQDNCDAGSFELSAEEIREAQPRPQVRRAPSPVVLCGNRVVDPGETCDDGNNDPTDNCVKCRDAFCGDGFVWKGKEQCDDGNKKDGDGCNRRCLRQR